MKEICFNDWSKVWRLAQTSKIKILSWKFVGKLQLGTAIKKFCVVWDIFFLSVKSMDFAGAFFSICKKSLPNPKASFHTDRFGQFCLWPVLPVIYFGLASCSKCSVCKGLDFASGLSNHVVTYTVSLFLFFI